MCSASAATSRKSNTPRDISARKASAQQLSLANSVLQHTREGLLITDATGNIVEVNPAFTHITGFTRAQAIGRSAQFLVSAADDGASFSTGWQRLQEVGHWVGEISCRRASGEVFVQLQNSSAVRDSSGAVSHYVTLFSDITERKQQEAQLEQMAHFDALTGLANRTLLMDRLQHAMAQALRRDQRLALAYIDLDGFKQINDRWGHDAGDALLQTLAQRMKQALREGDTLARVGGDEFTALLIDLDHTEDCEFLLLRLLQAARQVIDYQGVALQVSASIGVNFYPQTQEIDADQLLSQADHGMYQAKMAGKNQYHFCLAQAA